MTSIFRILLGCLLFVFVLAPPTKATHLRGGELTYQSDTTTVPNPLRYFFKLSTYLDANSTADEPTATLYLGDGISITTHRVSKIPINNSCGFFYQNTYYFEYTFAGPGQYTAVYRPSNRTRNIVNFANSDQQVFTLMARFTIDIFDATNRSPRFLTGTIPCAVLNQPFRHSLAATDLEGDSLVHELITPLNASTSGSNMGVIQNGSGYTLPAQVSLNSKTGELVWDQPDQLGTFSFAVRTSQYRNKRLVGSMMRDFLINVIAAPDNFTQSFSIENRSELSITDENQIFLTAGQPLKIKVKYQTNGRVKRLEAFSELFITAAGTIKLDTTSAAGTALAELTLNPEEAWRRNQPYILIFRGTAAQNGVVAQQDFTLTLVANPELVSGGTDEGPGTPETDNNGLFVVYPNPAQTYFRVKNNRPLIGAQCLLYNSLQQVILQTNLNGPDTRITLPQIATGIYFYQIISGNSQVRQSGKLHVE